MVALLKSAPGYESDQSLGVISSGIKQICIVTSTQHMGDIVTLLGSGKEMGVDFTYKVQEKTEGIAHALKLTENFA